MSERARWQGTWQRIRTLHTYASLLGVVLALFFGVTGFMMHHAERLGLDRVREEQADAALASAPEGLTPLALVEEVRARFDVRGALVAFEQESQSLRLCFARPGERTDVTISRRDGALHLRRERRGLAAALTEVHTGEHSGALGGLIIDATAILLITIALTGVGLWLSLPKRRRLGLAALAISAGLLAAAGWYLSA